MNFALVLLALSIVPHADVIEDTVDAVELLVGAEL